MVSICADEMTKDNMSKESKNKVYLNIMRDPRNVVVSGCYHLGKAGTIKQTEECIMEMYPVTILWIKLRELAFTLQDKLKNKDENETSCKFINVSYAKLLNESKSEIVKIVNVMGFGRLLGNENTLVTQDINIPMNTIPMINHKWHTSAPTSVKNEHIEQIIRLTSAQSMRNRSNFDVVARADTLREGGKRTFLDYGFSTQLTDWMTGVLESLKFTTL
jgi:hypothetical protein